MIPLTELFFTVEAANGYIYRRVGNDSGNVAAFTSRSDAEAWIKKLNYLNVIITERRSQSAESNLTADAPVFKPLATQHLTGGETNMASGIYEVIIVEVPSAKEQETGAVERIVVGPVSISATSKEAAIVAASGMSKITPLPDANRLKVIVRPFVGS